MSISRRQALQIGGIGASPGRSSQLGVATINALGIWSLTAKPCPAQQVMSVRAESSRGGTSSRAVDTR
jgi:hypothetical protein